MRSGPRMGPVGRRPMPRVIRALLLFAWSTAIVAASLPALAASPLPRPTSTPVPPPALEELRLPDLRTLDPSDLRLRVRPDGSRRLRLANTVWNGGAGPLELRGEPDPSGARINVFQVLYAVDGSTSEQPVGEFTFHPTHAHWHLDDFAVYELWSLSPTAELHQVVASSDKVSYCMIDTDLVAPQLEGVTEAQQYRGCGRLRQGLSIGWGDHYHAGLDGQELELGLLSDGIYALVSSANRSGRILESDAGNNAAVIYIALTGSRVSILSSQELAREFCLPRDAC